MIICDQLNVCDHLLQICDQLTIVNETKTDFKNEYCEHIQNERKIIEKSVQENIIFIDTIWQKILHDSLL